MSNSNLVALTINSPNNSGKRTHSIDRITPHCMAGQLSARKCGELFSRSSYQASSNYGIGTGGEIALYVPESRRSWCSSSESNDQRAVTIECASDAKSPYAMNSKVYASLIRLCVDICRRNGKTKLLWLGDKSKTLKYAPKADEMVLTVHRWFAAKSCPGDWLYCRLGELAQKVTAQLAGAEATAENKQEAKSEKLYHVYAQKGAFANKINAEKLAADLTNTGQKVIILEE